MQHASRHATELILGGRRHAGLSGVRPKVPNARRAGAEEANVPLETLASRDQIVWADRGQTYLDVGRNRIFDMHGPSSTDVDRCWAEIDQSLVRSR